MACRCHLLLTLFAIAPLIIVVVELTGFSLGRHQVVLNQLHSYMSSTAGPAAVQGIKVIVTATFSQRKAGLTWQIVG